MLCKSYTRVLGSLGHKVRAFINPIKALNYMEKNNPPDVLILDGQMPYLTGPELATKVRRIYQNLPVVFLTGSPTPDMAIPMSIVLTKPFEVEDLQCSMKYLVNGEW